MYRLLPTEEDAREEDRTGSGANFDPEASSSTTRTRQGPLQSMAQKFKSLAPSFLYSGGGGNGHGGSSSNSGNHSSTWWPWSTTVRTNNNNNSPRARQRTDSNTSGNRSLGGHNQQHQQRPHQPPMKKKVEYKLDRLFLKRLSRLFGILFTRGSRVLYLYIGMTLFCCLNEGVVYWVGTIPSRFYKVLGDKDSAAFMQVLVSSLVIVFVAGFGKCVVFLFGGLLSLETRRSLTLYFHRIYIQPKLFYRIITMHDEEIDNPDQRITQDIEKLAEAIRKMIEDLLISPLLITFYTWQCYKMAGYYGPLIIYGFFIVSSVASRWLINPIVDAIFYRESAEGYFRFLHVRLRQFTESITFSRGEAEAKRAADDSLESLLCSQLNLIYKELPLNFLQKTVSYFGSIMSYVIVAIPIFLGKYDDLSPSEISAVISKISFVSMYLTFLFSQIIKCGAEFSDLAGYTSRMGQLMEALDMLSTEMENIAIDYPHEESLSMDSSIRFENVTFSKPGGERILSGFSHRFEAGVNTVIVGPNGSGKTSILRVMGGLWPVNKGMMFTFMSLKDAPYMTYGTLREQLVYPNKKMAPSVTDSDILRLLKLVRLEHLVDTLDDFDQIYTLDWTKMLSPGEQQKMAFARLFYARPMFAERFHQQRIALDGQGGWSCSEISQPQQHRRFGGSGSVGVLAEAPNLEADLEADDVEIDTLGGTADDSE
ncbi:ATP-binding cassette sub- D member 4 [Mortierella sp. AD032]|nr:ATP-binding cassette sub- D member 4 [Mortierella sp. AD032]